MKILRILFVLGALAILFTPTPQPPPATVDGPPPICLPGDSFCPHGS